MCSKSMVSRDYQEGVGHMPENPHIYMYYRKNFCISAINPSSYHSVQLISYQRLLFIPLCKKWRVWWPTNQSNIQIIAGCDGWVGGWGGGLLLRRLHSTTMERDDWVILLTVLFLDYELSRYSGIRYLCNDLACVIIYGTGLSLLHIC
jgi:hypothetical protein